MVTLKDLARETGCSIKTVSRAIHDHPDINPQTRVRIMAVVQRHGYSPNWAAQSLRSRRTQTIGLVVPNITNGFFGQIGMTVDAFFREHRYNTLICFTSARHENELESLHSLLVKNIDGLIFAPVGDTGDYFDRLPALRKKPLVIIDNKCRGIDAHYVLHDNRHGSGLLVDHLAGHGHRRIACVTGPVEETSGAERLEGYRAALERHGLPPDDSLVRVADWEIGGGYAATLDLFGPQGPRPSAVFYANSQMLLGAYRAFHELRLAVPGDAAVVAFDPPFVIDSLTPRPTTLSGIEAEIGLAAARLLHRLMSGQADGAGGETRLRSELVPGSSCGCP